MMRRRFRVGPPWSPLFSSRPCSHSHQRRRRLHASSPNSGPRQGNFILPGATAATIVMFGILHARRMYQDQKVVEMKEKGIEPEFSPDFKASFLRLLPLRSMSRLWGSLMEVELPVFMRPAIYKSWARAFHSNLQEAALPLEEYPSLQAFFIRSLKEGSRPIDADPNCLVSPVDGKVLRLGELRGPGTMIEQVKGFSYSAASLLGASSSLHGAEEEDFSREHTEQSIRADSNVKSWWRVSVASPKLRDQTLLSPKKGIFYCVIYLNPGDYHRVHSPVDWHIIKRRHFSGHLFPQNERAVRTIRNLYVENERVILEGQWKEGFVALAAIGATSVGSIKLFIEPELRTNRAGSKILNSQRPDERVYEPAGTGVMVKKGEEVAGFRMGSTVVMVFEAPVSKAREDGRSVTTDFDFCIKAGDRIRVGEAIGRWSE
uniref:Phosphatidylserine decarboxylase proenzyme 1, mitochondrial n=1 Tax=Leersia perrieri TaxID=77586 RepID=A0A0D9VN93_9ORYZ